MGQVNRENDLVGYREMKFSTRTLDGQGWILDERLGKKAVKHGEHRVVSPGGVSVAPEVSRIISQEIFFLVVVKAVKESGIAFFKLGHHVVHLPIIGKLGILNAAEFNVLFRMYDFEGDDFFMEGTIPDPCNHLLLDKVLVVPEHNKAPDGVSQEKEKDYDDG